MADLTEPQHSVFLTRESVIKWAPLLVLIFLVLFFPVFEMMEDLRDGEAHVYLLDSRFISIRNFSRIEVAATPALMVAIGVTFIILMGSIDLSMEGTVSVSAVIFAYNFLGVDGTVAGLGILAIPLVLIVGAVMGPINSLVRVKLRIPFFMVSLAMGFVGTGVALMLTGGDRIRVEDEWFRMLLTYRILNFPLMCYVALLMLLIGWFIQERTTLGRNFYAIGGAGDVFGEPARLVIPAPDNVEKAVLALTEPLACVVRAARKAQITSGQSVVVIGAWPIGNFHVQLLRTIGAAPIIVSDVSEARLAMAKDGGADITALPGDLRNAVMDATDGRGADVVIESVGNAKLYREALTLTRKGGHLAVFGLTRPEETIDIPILDTILQENSLKGSVAGMGSDMREALTLLTWGRIKTDAFTGAEYDLADIQEAFDSHKDRPQHQKTQIVMGGTP